AVPNASVVVKDAAKGDKRETKTADAGRYTFSQLAPGTYELTVEASGFRKAVASNVALQASQSSEFNVSLTVGDLAQNIEVSAAAPLLDTQTANKSVTLNAQQVLDLPVNARDPLVLVHSTAGVTGVRTGVSTATTDQNHNRFALNGGRDESSLILIDGVPATAVDWGGALAMPSVDSVQEVQVMKNTFDVQYGKTDGGVVSLVTKGGTNGFHGSAFEFLRNNHLDANSWTNNRSGLPRTIFQRNQFGGSLGGPIWKSKRLFFYGAYEGLRQGAPNTNVSSVPTALERTGNFSRTFNSDGSLAVIYDPATTRANPNGPGFVREAFAGNIIPANRFDPIAQKVLNLYPLPNATGDPFTNARNFALGGKGVSNNDRMDVRVDWAKSERYTFFARVTKAWQQDIVPSFFGSGADSNFGGMNPRHQIIIGNTFVPNPTWVINVLVGSGRWREVQISPSQGRNATQIGFPAALVTQFSALTLPQFNVSNYAQLDNPRFLDDPRQTHNLQINNTKELGSHSLKFGFIVEAGQINPTDVNSPTFSFTRGFTSGPNATVDSSVTGNAVASLLLGTGSGGSAPTNVRLALTQLYYAGYVQDTWRFNRRLTVNYGLRYEIQLPRTERYNRFNYFDFNATNPLSQQTGLNLKGGLAFDSSKMRGLWNADASNFAPRVGIAYKVTDKLVARTGYGIFYPPTVAVSNGTTDGFSTTTPWVSSQGGGGILPGNPLSNPFPGGLNQPLGSSQGLLTLAGNNISAFQRLHPSGYVQSFSFDLQYQISNSSVVEIGYSGTLGRKLLLGNAPNLNQIDPKYLSLGSALNDQISNPFYNIITSGNLAGPSIPRYQLLRPYPQFASVTLSGDTPGAGSSFNALNAKYSQRFSGGLSAVATYQWSKAIDNTSETQAWEIGDVSRNSFDRGSDRSVSGHDLPQSFVGTIVYELPAGKGKKFGSSMNKVANAALGGWQVATIARLSSGLPLQVSAPNTLSVYGFNVLRPNITNLKNLNQGQRTPDHWFNTAAVTAPAPFTLGNAPRWLPNVRYAPIEQADVSLQKNFRYREFLRAQLRAEAFNVANSVQFGRASTTVGAADFGRVTSYAPGG
ncbi:MAG: carboxypeptidase regulatory-like domain-containing protein, partial [Acidobacteriota bacterium]|nr:carboxypeptidase regulatory-like domain-containing protein [Acidobacteriota bacterium]